MTVDPLNSANSLIGGWNLCLPQHRQQSMRADVALTLCMSGLYKQNTCYTHTRYIVQNTVSDFVHRISRMMASMVVSTLPRLSPAERMITCIKPWLTELRLVNQIWPTRYRYKINFVNWLRFYHPDCWSCFSGIRCHKHYKRTKEDDTGFLLWGWTAVLYCVFYRITVLW